MLRSRDFSISYLFKDIRQVFVQSDFHMTDADAWYYSCLHARVDLLYGTHNSQADNKALRAHAEKSGLADVTWDELS
ncbi:DUF6555 family protein [Pseudomonas sp. P7759]|uniref:DUF6555 family protein n=1 Tax=Pseudomonas sp. P7759 TaxID=2738831 RepID=UPI0035294224